MRGVGGADAGANMGAATVGTLERPETTSQLFQDRKDSIAEESAADHQQDDAAISSPENAAQES